MRYGIFILMSILLLMPGCNQIKMADYSGFTNIDSNGMPTGFQYEFSPSFVDSTFDYSGEYDVVIAVRFTNSCPSQQVIFNIEEFSLEQELPDSLTLEIPLFGTDGLPLGQKYYGVSEVTDTIRKGFRVPEGYSLSLSSPLPTAATSGIKAVGLVLINRKREVLLFR